MTKEKNDMTNEHNFKVGDKVATTKPYNIVINCIATTIPIGKEGVIERVDGEELLVYFFSYDCALTWMANEVGPIQPIDYCKPAFLTRLQSLLREFDAEIVFHCDNKQETIATSIIVGKSESRRNEVYGVTADNIMDFDKEGV